jgi:uncharacterized SAM-binding protein YcdF (DUF218 family)
LIFLLSPFFWLVILLGLYFYIKNGKWKNRLKWTSLTVFLLFTNSVVFSEFCRLWEVPGNKIESVGNYDVAGVLGGMSEYNNDIETLSIRRQGDRIFQAVTLYKKGKVKKILISGDSGYITERGLKEAKRLKEILVTWGIPATDIITEEKSKNTHENAKFSVELLRKSYPELKRVLLVTSGMHMKRSLACFKKEGVICSPYSTDLYANQNHNYYWDQYLIPNFDNLITWHKLLKEVVGFVTYDIVGYI